MQYVRGLAGTVAKTYNSINPATLSGAIDVIVIEQEDGTLSCSPFHVRFGKVQILRPSEKKVEFRVNGEKQDYAMKLGEGGEAFFVFETEADIPPSMQTSPLVSPSSSPPTQSASITPPILSEPSFLDLSDELNRLPTPDPQAPATAASRRPLPSPRRGKQSLSDRGPISSSFPGSQYAVPWQETSNPSTLPAGLHRSTSENAMDTAARRDMENLAHESRRESHLLTDAQILGTSPERSSAPPPELKPKEAFERAMTLSKKLSTSNIRSRVTDTGDLMLDMTGYKSSEDEALRAEAIARNLLAEEMEGNYDIGALIGTDELGNLWIYSSEDAKDAANRRAIAHSQAMQPMHSDSTSDPGYHSDSDRSSSMTGRTHTRAKSEEVSTARPSTDSTHFAKTLRLTSPQLKKLNLGPGPNPISFTVNKSVCTASMYLWKHNVPIVISDIDGTITKSDALGHVFTMIGRDWTHPGVAKLYSDIVANGYNIFYLTSRSVGQADTTRGYLSGVTQDGYALPKGPVIMSPDRTYAALRREVYLRKPEVFKMQCLRDIRALFPGRDSPFYAGFGNRLTDAVSYRTVKVPPSRIFTISSNGEVCLDLVSLHRYKSTYVSIREVVDHFFPPVTMLVKEGGEEYTDFKYWRDDPSVNLDDFVPSESEDEDGDDPNEELGDSYISRESTMQRIDSQVADGIIRESIEVDYSMNVNRLRLLDGRKDNHAFTLETEESDLETNEFISDYVDRNESPRRDKSVSA